MDTIPVDEKGREMPVTAFRFEALTGSGVVDYSTAALANPNGGIMVYISGSGTFKFVAKDNTNQSTFVTLTDEKGFFPVLLSKIDWSGTTQTIYRIK